MDRLVACIVQAKMAALESAAPRAATNSLSSASRSGPGVDPPGLGTTAGRSTMTRDSTHAVWDRKDFPWPVDS